MNLMCLLLMVSTFAITPVVEAQSAPAPDATTLEELETVLVVGERPGPALWKVTSRKGNTLWILPTYGPLPDGLVLRSSELEAVIRESQEVHFLTGVNAPKYLASDERAQKAFRNVDGKFLQDVMPAGLYAQFQNLDGRYGNSTLAPQMLRPLNAADWLKQSAMQRLQLNSDRAVNRAVWELAEQHGVPTFGVKMKRDEVWDEMMERLDKTPREDDVPCAQEKLDRLEKDLRDSVARANAWAKGDIAMLRQDAGLHDAQTDGPVCAKFFRKINVGRVQARALKRFSYTQSVKVLKNNRSTLALVPIADLFEKDGLIARLKRASYKVEQPAALSDAGQ